ncbi:L-type lectin-domain containing receptor kinase V.7-like [Pistacia vera]|uniref:L-type lectin-domain containing receptor kinase V.7-like n=1 Tax=Pistacia vera TaxID=55513 RepID=UPI0012637FA9|nr:L-type lectin-domain containing receptor kinase V.7-like [Pistacia vera]
MWNLALCGFDPQLKVPPCKSSAHRRSKVLLLIILSLSTTVTLVVLVLLFVLLKCRKKDRKLRSILDISPQETWRRISYQELVRATCRFNEHNLLGKGHFGSIYKGRLGDDMELAVKVFYQQFEEAFTSFELNVK